MKRVLTFIGLKVAEILGVVFIPWGIGLILRNWVWFETIMHFEDTHPWLIGIVGLIMGVMLPGLFIAWLVILVVHNWEWATKLTTKKGGNNR